MRAIFAVLAFVAVAAAAKCSSTGCSSGQCCSYWGYCGKGTDYCGSGKYQCACDCNGSKPCKSSSCTNYKTTTALNVRKGPSTSYTRVKTLNSGTTVCVVSITNGWAKLSDGYYVSAQYIKKYSGSTGSTGNTSSSCTNYKTTTALNVRKGPSTSYTRVKTLNSGTTVCVVSITNGWAKLSDGYYVSAQYIKKYSGSTGSNNNNNNSGNNNTATTSGSTKSSQLGLTISQRSSPNKSSRNGWKPDVIVCHITEGAYAGAVSWLCNPQAQASCHFVVSKKGEISQLVPFEYASWCQGISSSQYSKATSSIVRSRKVNPNWYAVGIEHEGMWADCKGCLTSAQTKAAGKLIKYIALKLKETYGVNFQFDREHIIGHYQVNPTNKPNCPGANYPWSEVISIAKSA